VLQSVYTSTISGIFMYNLFAQVNMLCGNASVCFYSQGFVVDVPIVSITKVSALLT